MKRRRIFGAVVIAFILTLLMALPALAGDAAPVDKEAGSNILDGVSNLDLWAIFAGAATSYVAGILNRCRWRSDVKFGVFGIMSIGSAAMTAYWKGDLDAADYKRTLLIVLVSGITTYKATKGAVQSLSERTG